MQTGIIIVVLVVILLFVLIYYLRERHYNDIETLNQLKIDIYNDPVDELFVQAEEIKFSGASKEEYEEDKERWLHVQENNFPRLANAISDAEKSVDTFRLHRAKRSEEEAEEIIRKTNEEIFALKNNLNKFLEAAENNQQEIAEMHELYEENRKELLTKSFNFGPAVPGLEDLLKQMEDEFNKFTVYTSQGDHVQARERLEVVKQLNRKTSNYMRRIPKYLQKLDQDYPEDVKQLSSGYRELKKKGISFSNDHILEDIADAEESMDHIYDLIERLDLKQAKQEMDVLERDINDLYHLMENEYQAQVKVNEQFTQLREIFETLYERNRQIKIETDRMSQLYLMSDETLSYGAKMEQEISRHENNYERIRSEVAQSDIIYSQLSGTMDKLFNKTQQLYDQQNLFLDNLYGLADEEEKIKNDLDDFAYRMSAIKQKLDRSNLPGLPSDFYEYYAYTTNRIKELAQEVDKVRLDMQEVRYLYDLVSEDVPALEQDMDDMLLHAEATELIIQNLNKYRHEYSDINEVFDMLSHYYYTEHNYKRAFTLAAETLNKIAPKELDDIQERLGQ